MVGLQLVPSLLPVEPLGVGERLSIQLLESNLYHSWRESREDGDGIEAGIRAIGGREVLPFPVGYLSPVRLRHVAGLFKSAVFLLPVMPYHVSGGFPEVALRRNPLLHLNKVDDNLLLNIVPVVRWYREGYRV